MEWILDETTRTGELKLTGDLCVEEASEFKRMVLQAFDEAEQVTLSLENVVNFDIAGLQVICACHRFSVAHQKRFFLKTGESRVFAQAVEDTGFAQWALRSFGEEQVGEIRDRQVAG